MRYIVVVTLFTCIPNGALGQEEISVKTIHEIGRAIVPIVCGYVDEHGTFQIAQIVGSGFFVDTFGRFVTAGHVLNDWDRINREKHTCFPAFYIPHDGWGKFRKVVNMEWFPFTNCIRDSSLDLAVCQPIENPFTSARVHKESISPVTFDTNEWPDGTPIAFSGFPLDFAFPITSKGIIGGKLAIQSSDVYFDIVIDKSAWPGASGSLAYLSGGQVVGIIQSIGTSMGSGLAYAKCAAAIVGFLSEHPYASGQSQEPGKQQSKPNETKPK